MLRTKNRFSWLALILAKSFLYTIPLLAVDAIALLLITGTVSATTLTLVLFLEGGLGLLAGVGISLSSTPSISSLGETLFRTSTWSHESQKHAESVGLKWMVVSAILIILGFAVSVL